MSTNWTPQLINVWILSQLENCLRDLMDGDADLEIEGSEIPVAADQMFTHFTTNLACVGLQIIPIEKRDG